MAKGALELLLSPVVCLQAVTDGLWYAAATLTVKDVARSAEFAGAAALFTLGTVLKIAGHRTNSSGRVIGKVRISAFDALTLLIT